MLIFFITQVCIEFLEKPAGDMKGNNLYNWDRYLAHLTGSA